MIGLLQLKAEFNISVEIFMQQILYNHHFCSINFRTDRDVPQQYRSCPTRKQRKSGRPRYKDQEQAFLEMCFYLEANDKEQLTISDLGNKMKEFLADKTIIRPPMDISISNRNWLSNTDIYIYIYKYNE